MNFNDIYCQAPCNNCPFRKDSLKGWLGEQRMKGITEQISFVCHKDNTRQCAGHLIINEKDEQNGNSSFYRLAQSLVIDLKLKNKDIIFDTIEEVIKHHKFI